MKFITECIGLTVYLFKTDMYTNLGGEVKQ
jgi:hypothetical protein